MRDSEKILTTLVENSKKENYVFERIYRFLYNPQLYRTAFDNIYKRKSSRYYNKMISFPEHKIEPLIESLKNESYKPIDVTIKTKQSIEDILVQEICRMLLSSIYESSFSVYSQGYRERGSSHSALLMMKESFLGVSWFINVDLLDNIKTVDANNIDNILKLKIKDDKFIRLINKFLKFGYYQDFLYNKTFSGIPIPGILNRVILNLYLMKLDEYVKGDLSLEFNKGKSGDGGARTTEYRNVEKKKYKLKKRLLIEDIGKVRDGLKEEYKRLSKKTLTTKRIDDSKKKFKKVTYCRYASSFILGVYGNKKDAEEVKKKIIYFLKKEYDISLEDSLKVASSKDAVRFLGYDISIVSSTKVSRNIEGKRVRAVNRKLRLRMPEDVMIKFLINKKMIKDINEPGWKSNHRPELLKHPDYEIISIFNYEIKSLYNYYALAENVSNHMWNYMSVAKWSCLKTLANKHKTSVSKIINKLSDNKRICVGVGTKRVCLYDDGFKMKTTPNHYSDELPVEKYFTK